MDRQSERPVADITGLRVGDRVIIKRYGIWQIGRRIVAIDRTTITLGYAWRERLCMWTRGKWGAILRWLCW